MRRVVWIVLAVILAGCVSTPPEVDEKTNPPTTIADEPPQDDTEYILTSKAGLENAKKRILAIQPDAVLVGVAGSGGKSAQWEYQYDSLKGKKGYAVEMPSGQVRERPYSFRDGLGDSFADSDKAAALCKADSGEFNLEVQDGRSVWTVIAGGEPCLVDAATGTLLGGDI
jgi:hypothetical protein